MGRQATAYAGPRFPLADLLRATRQPKIRVQRALRVSGTTFRDYEREGLPVHVADRGAIAFGLHPALVWPWWVDDVSPLDQLLASLELTRPAQEAV